MAAKLVDLLEFDLTVAYDTRMINPDLWFRMQERPW